MEAISAFTQPVIFTFGLNFICVFFILQYFPNHLFYDFCWFRIIPLSHIMLTLEGLKMGPPPSFLAMHDCFLSNVE
jgi:undecaprenyl pyrophosphate phosphatase UppP